ncbi:MAG: hypothetical protein ACYTDU_15690 [Planctomycetota bacterium]|jgi:hypothetical protein
MSPKKSTKTNRRAGTERRSGSARRKDERRTQDEAGVPERRSGEDRREPGPDTERRKVERRINEYRLSPEVLEFINAVNDFKSVHQKPFPTWSEIFAILTSLGYRKVEE